MATKQPGLEPGRKLEATNASFTVDSPNPEHQTSSQFENVQSQAQEADVSENTETNQLQAEERSAEATVEQETEQQSEQPTTERADRRIQDLANQREQEMAARLRAEAEASQYRQMLNNLVNAQPKQSDEDILAKQYKSYNASLGYPEDPKEFSDFNRNQSILAARQAAAEETMKRVSQDDMNRTLAANPELATDQVLQALTAVRQAEAQRQGFTLSYSQAVALAKKDMAQRFQKETTASVVDDNQAKNEAYVETTRGASTNRSSVQTPSAKDINKMSLAEMERALKDAGEW